MNLFLAFCVVFAIYILFFILIIIVNKDHPPFIEKGKTGKKNLECYIVSVWTVITRGPGTYRHYYFVKRKNGKYRLKFYSALEWISGLGYLSFYIWMIENHWDSILKYPEMEIPSFLGIFLLFLSMWTALNNASIVARIYFHKYMKKHIKGKRR